MKRIVIVRRSVAVLLVFGLLAGILLASGCGGGVPSGSVAKVGDTSVTKAQFDELMKQVKTQATNQSATFPKAGSAAYDEYAAGIVEYLVQQELVTQNAGALKAKVTGAEVNAQIATVNETYGGAAAVKAALEQQGLTLELFKRSIREQLLTQRVAAAVVKGAEVTPAQMQAHWEQHAADYQKKATRKVRHVLVSTNVKAMKVRALLVAGASWKQVAKKYSTDTGTSGSGGSLGAITQGQMVAAFDKAAFALDKGVISQPVKTTYGWHVLQVTGATPAKKVTYAKARAKVRQTLLQEAKQKLWVAWLAKVTKDAPVLYAKGYDPKALTASASASASPSPSPSPSTTSAQ